MRKKVLLVWWYDRRDLIAPYLEMQDDIEFTVLFYRFPEQEDKSMADTLPFKRIYWLDYHSPYEILNDVNPDKILLFSNFGILTVSLIVAANIRKIETSYVSHGLRSELKDILKNQDTPQTILRYQKDNKYYTSKKWHTLLFLFMTISIRNPRTIKLVMVLLKAEYKFSKDYEKLIYIQDPLRKVSSYYLFAPENALMIHDLDHPDPSKIKYTGPYTLDKIFSDFKNIVPKEEDYWIIIDQPILGFDFNKRIDLYKEIALKAQSEGKKLYIKMHPMDYDNETENDSNIIWLKNIDNIGELIGKSSGVLGYYSALLLPVIVYKKCILFNINANIFVEKWNKLGVIKLLDLHNFKIDDIEFSSFKIDEASRRSYIEQFIVYTDGECQKRLESFILN